MLKYKQYNNYKNQQQKSHFKKLGLFKPRKFYIRKNKSKVDSIETGCIVIAHLL